MQFISFLPYIATGHMSFPDVPDVTGAEQMNSYYVKELKLQTFVKKLFLWDIFQADDLAQILFPQF